MNACVGSWECGKSITLPTFPQPLLFLFLTKNTIKITIQWGEGNLNAHHPRVKTLFKRLHGLNLTLQHFHQRGNNDTSN